MGVPVELWRARIGSFNGGGTSAQALISSAKNEFFYCAVFHFLIVMILLLIGNVESNPGPTNSSIYPCYFLGCTFKAKTTGEHIRHQQVHSCAFNFRYECPLPTCSAIFETFASVSAHISFHSVGRHKVSGCVGTPCKYCGVKVSTMRDLCTHFKKVHLKSGHAIEVMCPYENCSREKPFVTVNNFSVHLSLNHPGWREDFSNPLNASLLNAPFSAASEVENLMDVDDAFLVGDMGDESDEAYGDDCEKDSDVSVDDKADSNIYDYDSVVSFIGNFYAMMEGKHIIPSNTVNKIASKLAIISEILQVRLEDQLIKVLKQLNIPDNTSTTIVSSVLSMDPLYNTHHKNSLGTLFLTKAKRLEFYKEKIKYVAPTEINLKRSSEDREQVYHYVDIKETLRVLLDDSSVQKHIDTSFENVPNHLVLKDYTDGKIVREDVNSPSKRIDLFLFMDGFSCVNPLGSASRQYKMNGMYLSLGNLKPFLRSFQKSIRLVMMVNECILQESDKKFKKCFKRVVKILKELEKDGILYKGEMVPVRLQFFLGDNLGQHIMAGLVASFSSEYFCRFCDTTKSIFKEDANREKPQFRMGEWRTHETFSQDLATKIKDNLNNYRGVKRDRPLNDLQYFKACDSRMVPCSAHDLFISGVVDRDLAAMVKYFVVQGWFTYDSLQKRVTRFKYSPFDLRNKPAINNSGEKIGGHAIQNWTFLRLLPFFIPNVIETDDKIWELYLLLKSVCEPVCAPALTVTQIEKMRALIIKYMKKRKMLNLKYRPKDHYLLHYADLYILCGPVIHFWTLAFEHFHQYFKRVAHTCRNFINLGLTLSNKLQLLQAYQSYGQLYPSEPVLKNSSIDLQSYKDEIKNFLPSCGLSPDAIAVESIEVNNIQYKERQWLILRKDSNENFFFGKVEVLISDRNCCKAVVLMFRASLWRDYGLYCVEEADGRCIVSLDGELDVPMPQSVYIFQGKKCVSLKHVLVDSE